MNLPALTDSRLESFYSRVLRLYPENFRYAYAESMRQVFRDALRDASLPHRQLIPLILRDSLASIVKEHLSMLRDTFARPALVFNALILAGLATVLAFALYGIPQQVLRRGADDPQVEMADNLTWQLEQGVAPADAVPAGTIDLAHSLSPFLIAYDDQGNPLVSQAKLNGQTPALPRDLLDFVRQSGERRFSWGPGEGVRIAAILQRVRGTHPGFVLAGRSLREESRRQKAVEQMAAMAWAAMLALIFIGTTAFGWYTRPRPALSTR